MILGSAVHSNKIWKVQGALSLPRGLEEILNLLGEIGLLRISMILTMISLLIDSPTIIASKIHKFLNVGGYRLTLEVVELVREKYKEV